jgi:hypothetical protein
MLRSYRAKVPPDLFIEELSAPSIKQTQWDNPWTPSSQHPSIGNRTIMNLDLHLLH